MRVLSVASEMFPLAKTGGLGDVTAALPCALADHGVDMRVLLPGYRGVLDAVSGCHATEILELPLGRAELRMCTAGAVTVFVLDAPDFYDRPGGPYLAPDGRPHADNWKRFALLAEAAAWIARSGMQGWRPDLVHGHDWQAGLTAACLQAQAGASSARPPYVQTIHNIAFAGRFPAAIFPQLSLPEAFFAIEGVEFHGDVSFLKAGLAFADAITTVSPGYAEELLRPEFGGGFDGLLRARAQQFRGILNGIDTDLWNPETDPLIECRYTARSPGRRQINRRVLCRTFALDADRALIAILSRLTRQKGIDLALATTDDILARGFNLILLGTGDADLEQQARQLAARHPGRIGVHIGYDETLAHRIQAGTDALLVPSRFEPCGLTQLCALRYGAIPVVAATGGLADSVIDANPAALARGVATGIHLRETSVAGIRAALDRLRAILADEHCHRRMLRNAMHCDVSWQSSARLYRDLYARLLDRKPG